MAITDIASLRDRGADDRALLDAPLVDPRGAAFPPLAERHLGDVRAKLEEPLLRAALAARVLGDGLGGAHAQAVREVVEAIDGAVGMLGDVAECFRTASARRPTRLRSLCERVLDAVQARHPDYALSLERGPDVEGCWDPDAIGGMVARLALNGVHHGPRQGAVHVRVWGLDDRAILEVRSGAPLAADLPLQRLFEPFVCARPRRSDGRTGLGLGLHLADKAVREHHGRVEVKTGHREGTTFRVTLPTGG